MKLHSLYEERARAARRGQVVELCPYCAQPELVARVETSPGQVEELCLTGEGVKGKGEYPAEILDITCRHCQCEVPVLAYWMPRLLLAEAEKEDGRWDLFSF